MGATPETERNRKYFNVMGNRFTIRVKPNTPSAKARMTKPPAGKGEPKEVWELYFEDVSGKLKEVKVIDTEYGKKYSILLVDGPEELVIQLDATRDYADTFMKRLPNVDFTKPILLKAYSFIPADKDRTKEGISIFQAGNKIAPYYTKEEPNGLPQMDVVDPDAEDWKVFNIMVKKFLSKSLIILSDQIKAGYEAQEWTTGFMPDEPDPADTFGAEPSRDFTDDLPF